MSESGCGMHELADGSLFPLMFARHEYTASFLQLPHPNFETKAEHDVINCNLVCFKATTSLVPTSPSTLLLAIALQESSFLFLVW